MTVEIYHIWLFGHICMNVDRELKDAMYILYIQGKWLTVLFFTACVILYIFNLWKDLWNLQIKIMINWRRWRLTKRCMDRNKRPLYAYIPPYCKPNYVCSCPQPARGLYRGLLLVFSDLRRKVTRLADIYGNVNHHSLNFIFIMINTRNLKIILTHAPA